VTHELPRRLAPNARWAWRLQYGLFWVVVLVVVVMVGDPLPAVLRWLALLGLVVTVTVVPTLRWRSWRWDVRPDAIELRHGVLRVVHTVVPMARVQHVDTTSDIVEKQLGLASVAVHTAAGSHKIPLLRDRDAEEVRARIAALADPDEP
jgi:uncharacterized protein